MTNFLCVFLVIKQCSKLKLSFLSTSWHKDVTLITSLYLSLWKVVNIFKHGTSLPLWSHTCVNPSTESQPFGCFFLTLTCLEKCHDFNPYSVFTYYLPFFKRVSNLFCVNLMLKNPLIYFLHSDICIFVLWIFSSPCQRQGELLPSLGVRRLSSVNFSHFNLLLWNPSAKWTETW